MKSLLSTEKSIFLLIGGFTLLVLVGIIVLSVNEDNKVRSASPVTGYTASDSLKPAVSVSSSVADLGNMKVKDEKSATFTIRNKGQKPLQLFKVSASCNCTFGQLTVNGVKSPLFSMHSTDPWVGNVDPGGTADLTVIYRPYLMPVSGPVTRDVYVGTNDPVNSSLTFTVKANVE